MQHNAIRCTGTKPHAFHAVAWRDGPETGLADEVQHIPQEIGLNDLALVNFVDFAVAQMDRLAVCGNCQPVIFERAAIVTDSCNILSTFIMASDKNQITALKIGQGGLERRIGFGCCLRSACHFIDGMSDTPKGVFNCDLREVVMKFINRRVSQI